MKPELIFVISLIVIAKANYEDKLTKLWSMADEGQRTAVVNVTTASIVINPAYKQDPQKPQYRKYAFKPRAIPLHKQEQQVERNMHYANQDNYKSEILFPGNYFPIAEVKRKDVDTTYNHHHQMQGSPFHPKIIPLFRNEQFRRRSLDVDEPIIEKPEGYEEPIAMRRSISYFFGGDEDLDDDDDEEVELDVDKEDDVKENVKRRKIKIKKKYAKYMLPLLLAYKMKFFSLVPLMIGGLVLLVGATGMAGFFFALFAAVMGLQKGSY